jgi:hypothetical protein
VLTERGGFRGWLERAEFCTVVENSGEDRKKKIDFAAVLR